MNIYLVWQHPLLRDSIVAILEQAGLCLVGQAQGHPDIAQLRQLQVDVVIFEEGQDVAETLLLQAHSVPHLRLICVNLVDNKLFIYQREERLLSQMFDLIAALHP